MVETGYTSPHLNQSVRSFTLSYGKLSPSISVPASLYSVATQLRDEFLMKYPAPSAEAIENDTDEVEFKQDIHLVARFIGLIAAKEEESHGHFTQLLNVFTLEFERTFLAGNEVHAVAARSGLEIPAQKDVIKCYYRSRFLSGRTIKNHGSALLNDPKVSLGAIFGGQGYEDYFEELVELYDVYAPFAADLVHRLAKHLLDLSQNEQAIKVFSKGLDVLAWLAGERPDRDYLVCAPVSLPLIGLTQLVQFYVTAKILGLDVGEFAAKFSASTGHSQGIVVAAVISASTDERSFFENAKSALTCLFWIGVRSQLAFPTTTLPPSVLSDSLECNEGAPSPMLTVRDLPMEVLNKHIKITNTHLPEDRKVCLSLINGPRSFVVSGPARSLISVPFHSSYLEGARADLENDLKDISFGKLQIPVYATDDARDLRAVAPEKLPMMLAVMITVNVVHWEEACNFPGVTHIIDFGPGGLSGVGSMTRMNKDGRGVRIIVSDSFESIDVGSKTEIFDRDVNSVQFAPNWLESFSPKVVKTTAGRCYVDTRMSRMLGVPPLWCAGMTPTTVSWEFCSAIAQAGYTFELAGGGYFDPNMMREAIHKLSENIPAGSGICVNVIYINPRTYAWQIPLIKAMVAEGYPIRGVTIAAGIPSLEVANELISDLGVQYICLKPGSTEAVNSVISIAKANPHSPSGFGGSDDTLPYLTGEWSDKFKLPPMPFDGVLFGSRLMVAKEARTSLGVKQAIVDAPGVEDKDWEKTYDGPAGGIVTVLSELGEPIHKLATRGVMFWKEMDDTIFSLPRPKRLPALLAKKSKIIKKLNEDFQKVYFPAHIVERVSAEKFKFEAVNDLAEMTYAEVLYRLIDLMYVTKDKRWIDITLRNMTGNYMRRVEERFTNVTGKTTIVEDFDVLSDPYTFADKFLTVYPEAKDQLINSQDAQHFFTMCANPLQKPVPFVPAIDETFEFFFKKDSLWQSEDLDAVVGEDVGRVAILQGPMAARHSTKVNEPVKEMLDNIHNAHIAALTEKLYGSEDKVPTVEYFGGEKPLTLKKSDLEGMTFEETAGEQAVYTAPLGSTSALPNLKSWFEILAGPEFSWRRAIFTTARIAKNWKLESNPVRRIFAPRYGQKLILKGSGDAAVVELYETVNGIYSLSAILKYNGENIICTLTDKRNALKEHVGLDFIFNYNRAAGYCPISEVLEGRNDRIKRFYWKVWFGNEPYPEEASITDTFTGPEVEITGSMIDDFCRVVGNQNEVYTKRGNAKRTAPMDFAIVVGWQAITKAIFPKTIDGDLLRLVHLSNAFRMLGETPLREGDKVKTSAVITAVINRENGKMVEVKGTLSANGTDVLEVVTRFLYRGNFTDFENTFEHTQETPMELTLSSPKDVAVLQSKAWFQVLDPERDLSGASLTFRLNSYSRFKNKTIRASVQTKGVVLMELPTKEVIQVASVDFQSVDCHGNPVMEFLKRQGKPIEQPVEFENGGYSLIRIMDDAYSSTFVTPPTNTPYAEVSGDYNPIHVSSVFAAFVQLPGVHGITHGMFNSAATRRFVETFAAQNVPDRVKQYEVKFVNMALPNSELVTKLSHVGMINGRKIIKIQVVNKETEEVVIVGSAEVEQPVTAYVFTGQGSQEQNMGMDLYSTSPVARAIWDSADNHFLSNFGFSILDIVRNNPKNLTIHFGAAKGQFIRKNYMDMIYEKANEDGTTSIVPVFPTITEESTSYTFTHPQGLLSATQFTQPALTLMEKAAFEDMRSRGLVQQNSVFAGHSLGEYSALSSMGDVMTIEDLVDLVFLRGLTMQNAVHRDAEGRSEYGMVAASPLRVSPTFNEAGLRFIVDHIAQQLKLLLEIVNFNVENQQYVVSGHLHSLSTMGNVLNFLKVQKIDFQKLVETLSMEQLKAELSEIVSKCHEKTLEELKKNNGIIELQRGYATIPLKIDVPFHSTFLRGGVRMFREYLMKRITPHQVNISKLRHKFIPNLTARPFDVTKEYFQEVYELTGSQRIKKIIQNWDTYASS
ncbi:fatty acid synthase beta subunit Fas1 [Schizosaccharomyces japonicus yFS275]|uniref:Fatty acid synthase subunit beta n=1 Tax=Schizosaccharomyces japonicus (strain yFS275 / FY16936) TaxID=402676 RepID=B6K5Y1_SCHJY|nr:fatty acid synthase beta subunit Fas1 [Schizosaccharomyces japonicus yFS275]EEB08935.2 fatty acid synthase beta subunit Fas1 [Schizosaccharomyces japonicus yFS275]